MLPTLVKVAYITGYKMNDLDFYINNMKDIEIEIHKNGNGGNPMFLTCVQFAIKTAEEVKKTLQVGTK